MNQTTGTLTAQMLIKEDAGSFTCLAENNAGRIEASVALVVVLKPIVEELENKTYAKGKKLKKKRKKREKQDVCKRGQGQPHLHRLGRPAAQHIMEEEF